MGLFSWLKREHADSAPKAQSTPVAEPKACKAAPAPAEDEWELLPAYVPVDPHDHQHAVVIASALAAGNRTTSDLKVKRVLMANPEHQRVTAIATALAAGALEQSSFMVTNIYKMKEGNSNAA